MLMKRALKRLIFRLVILSLFAVGWFCTEPIDFSRPLSLILPAFCLIALIGSVLAFVIDTRKMRKRETDSDSLR